MTIGILMELVLIIFIIIFLSAWIIIIHSDKRNIKLFLESQGNTVVSIKWKIICNDALCKSSKPGEGKSFYAVRYRDPLGNLLLVFCEIDILSKLIWGKKNYLVNGCKKTAKSL